MLTSAFTNRVFCQTATTWMSEGSFQNWYSKTGCEIEIGRTFNGGDEQDGFQWPAIYSDQDMQAAKGLWIGTTNYQDGVTLYPRKVVHVGPRVDGAGEFFPQVFELVSRFPAPVVTVNSIPQSVRTVTIDRIDPSIPGDRMIRNVVNTAIGITMTRRIFGFSQQFHDNYNVTEYTFRNVAEKTLTGVRFFFQYRIAICAETRFVIGNATGWGINSMVDTRGDGVKNDADDFEQAGNSSTPHMRIQYVWHGRYAQFTAYDNIGGPIWTPSTTFVTGGVGIGDPADTIGRLGAAQFAGFLTLHADRSPADPSDDLSQPSTTMYVGSDDTLNGQNDQFNTLRMQAEYGLMSSGHISPRHADKVQPDGKFDEPTPIVDSSLITSGGFSAANGYGPYTLAPGDSIRIVVAEGASGMSRDRCIAVGKQYKLGVISAKAKNDSVLTGKDSLFQTFRRASANYRNGWTIPQPPLPPKLFTVTSGLKRITLSWDTYAPPGPTISGFRIFRSVGKYNAPDSLIYAAGPGVRSYVDTLVTAGVPYFYYLLSVGNPAENSGSAMTPAGVALTSNRMYTQTIDGASRITAGLAPGLPGVPAKTALLQNFPNPFNPSTTIRFGLPNRARVTLTVYNTLGQQVSLLVNENREAGYHEVKFDGSGLASGVYFYRLQAGSYAEAKKLLLLR